MPRKMFPIWAFRVAFSLWMSLGQSSDAAERPNILFIITDDQRFDQMGNMNPMIHTPEMDRLAKEGVRFENAFVTTPICAASRASLLCGLVERTHRYTFKTPPLADEFLAFSFPKLLKEAGYHTGYVGKFGVTVRTNLTKLLYDEFHETRHPYWQKQKDGSMRHLTDIEGDFALRFLQEHVRSGTGMPFCLTIGFNAPHADDPEPQQYFWQKEVDLLYREVKVPMPPLSAPEFYSQLPDYLRDGTMNRHRWYWRFDFESKRQEMTKGYWRMISGVDLVLGRLREKLQNLNLASNTVIVLMGDNGYFLGDRGYAGKWLPYEPSIRVPLLMFDPSGRFTKPGLRPKAFALNIDLPATFLAIAGLPTPNRMQGLSLIPLAKGENPSDWRKDIWLEHLMMEPSIRKHEGVRTERYKYSRYFEASPILEELYDLQEDPLETINLVNSPKHKALLQQLRKRANQLRTEYGGEFSASIWRGGAAAD